VPTDRSSAGDPARTLALLWRRSEPEPASGPAGSTGRRGPRRTLDLDDVVEAAIALADEAGLEAVSIRRVAERVGRPPMSLYTYLPGKAELLDLMLDTVYLRMGRPATHGRPWRRRLAVVAETNLALYTAHPWAAFVSTLRPPLGPGQMAKYEYELSALVDSGLDDVEIDDSLTYLLTFVRSAARDIGTAQDFRTAQDVGATQGGAGGGTPDDDQDWWAVAGPLLARVLDPERYPLATRIGAAAGARHGSAHDPVVAYEFGLERTLDAIEALVERARPPR
jgi:AcrR family transcriptional regulator